jgi:hypothetical protein
MMWSAHAVNPSSIRIVLHGRIMAPSSTLIPIAMMNCWNPDARLILMRLPLTLQYHDVVVHSRMHPDCSVCGRDRSTRLQAQVAHVRRRCCPWYPSTWPAPGMWLNLLLYSRTTTSSLHDLCAAIDVWTFPLDRDLPDSSCIFGDVFPYQTSTVSNAFTVLVILEDVQ